VCPGGGRGLARPARAWGGTGVPPSSERGDEGGGGGARADRLEGGEDGADEAEDGGEEGGEPLVQPRGVVQLVRLLPPALRGRGLALEHSAASWMG